MLRTSRFSLRAAEGPRMTLAAPEATVINPAARSTMATSVTASGRFIGMRREAPVPEQQAQNGFGRSQIRSSVVRSDGRQDRVHEGREHRSGMTLTQGGACPRFYLTISAYRR